MPTDRITEIRERERAATPGHSTISSKCGWRAWKTPDDDVTWTVRAVWQDEQGRRVTQFIAMCTCLGADNKANAEFIAHARADIPWLLAELDARDKAIAEMEEEIDALVESRKLMAETIAELEQADE